MCFNIMKKQLKSQYLIRSVYGPYSVLNHLDNDEYIFIPAPGTYRVIGDDMTDIEAIDPSGGPMISKGTNLFDFKIEKIYQSSKNMIIFKIKR